MTEFEYLHYDVFTERPLAGNQLAVFPQAAAIEPELMQKIANEMAFPETTFVLPAAQSGVAAQVRIFTPDTELPMAGHPTIGTIYALVDVGRIAPGTPALTLALGIGPTPIRLEWESMQLKRAWMRQPLSEFGTILRDTKAVATALSVDERDISATGLPIQVVSSGVPFLFVPLRSRRAVDEVVLDRDGLLAACKAAAVAELPLFVFSLEKGDDNATAYSRMFAPVFGIAEDPATGGASGPLGAFLVRHNAVTAEQADHMISLQGVRMKRPSQVYISIGAKAENISSVEVGGTAVLVGRGTVRV